MASKSKGKAGTSLSAAKEQFKSLIEKLSESPRKSDVQQFVSWVKNLFPDDENEGKR
jgi:hypothetical protein